MFGKKEKGIWQVFGRGKKHQDLKLFIILLILLIFLVFLIGCWHKSRTKSAYISDLKLQVQYLQQYNDRLKIQIEELFQNNKESEF